MAVIARSTVYSVGDVGSAPLETGWQYRCIVSGRTGARAPRWGIVEGESFQDGSVVWETVRAESDEGG